MSHEDSLIVSLPEDRKPQGWAVLVSMACSIVAASCKKLETAQEAPTADSARPSVDHGPAGNGTATPARGVDGDAKATADASIPVASSDSGTRSVADASGQNDRIDLGATDASPQANPIAAAGPVPGGLGPLEPTIFVSPTGSDQDPGTASRPIATIARARDMVRALVKGGLTRHLVVGLRGGVYTQAESLKLTPEDSGRTGHYVVYQAVGYGTAAQERPVISGGKVISGWALFEAGRNIWKAPAGAGVQERHLHVNGVRARRGKIPRSAVGTITKTATGYTTAGAAPLGWRNPGDVELVYTSSPDAGAISEWTESHCGIASVAPTGTGASITMKEPCWTNGTTKKQVNQLIGKPTTFENAFEFLAKPGDFYLDKPAATLYYIPRPGENMATASVVSPVVEFLLVGAGTPESPIHDLQFRGLTFSYSTWSAPSGGDGFIELQANHVYVGNGTLITAPGAVALHSVQNVRFERNRFNHLGSQGLVLDRGAQNNVVIGNVFHDISGTGVRIGNLDAPNAPPAAQDVGNLVSNNYIHDIAVEYRGGVGIMGGYLARAKILHNEIANLPYTGISLGWGWGQKSYAEENEIAHNHIHHYLQVLPDGGGIYLLSPQGQSPTVKATVVHDNYLHDQTKENGSLYPDEGSAFMDLYRNVVAKSPRWLHIWTGSIHDITVRDNFSDTAVLKNQGRNISLANNWTAGAPWPAPAQGIMNKAGLEAAFLDLLQ